MKNFVATTTLAFLLFSNGRGAGEPAAACAARS